MTGQRSKSAKRFHARIIDYKKTFTSDHGKRVLYDLISSHYVMSPTFAKDAIEMALKEGERNVVLRILSVLKSDPDKIKNLIEEADKHVSKEFL